MSYYNDRKKVSTDLNAPKEFVSEPICAGRGKFRKSWLILKER